MKKIWKVPVTYSVRSNIYVTANTIQEAKEIAFNELGDGIPDNSSVLDDTIELDYSDGIGICVVEGGVYNE